MAGLRCAARLALPSGGRARFASSGAGPPTEKKSVPYEKTLKGPLPPPGQGSPRPLPASAEVVVVGGGSLGCQTLYHLAKMGVASAVLLERDRLTSGTTWHTAGEGEHQGGKGVGGRGGRS